MRLAPPRAPVLSLDHGVGRRADGGGAAVSRSRRAASVVGEAIRETVTSDLKTLGGVRVVERGSSIACSASSTCRRPKSIRDRGAPRQAARRHAHRRRRVPAVGEPTCASPRASSKSRPAKSSARRKSTATPSSCACRTSHGGALALGRPDAARRRDHRARTRAAEVDAHPRALRRRRRRRERHQEEGAARARHRRGLVVHLRVGRSRPRSRSA